MTVLMCLQSLLISSQLCSVSLAYGSKTPKLRKEGMYPPFLLLFWQRHQHTNLTFQAASFGSHFMIRDETKLAFVQNVCLPSLWCSREQPAYTSGAAQMSTETPAQNIWPT